MSSKREKILSTARDLFVQQGIRNTTIATIAESAGIAKGSVYSYFKSKSDIVKALFVASIDRSQSEIDDLLDSNIPPKEKLLEHIKKGLTHVNEEQAFHQAWMNEDSQIMERELISMVQNARNDYYQSQVKLLDECFDESLTEWLPDLVSVLNGLLQEYAAYVMLDNARLSPEKCSQFISFSVEQVADGLINNNKLEIQPILKEALNGIEAELTPIAKAEQILESMFSAISTLIDSEQAEAKETLILLQQQLETTPLSTIMIRALIANLKPYSPLENLRIQLAQTLDIEVI